MSTQVTVRFDITPESLAKAFPSTKSIKINKSGKTATFEFENANDAKVFSEQTSFQCPISQRPQVVYTKPDVTSAAPDSTKLVTITDTKTTTGGRIYKNTTNSTKHISSLKFAPVLNSVILPEVDFSIVQIQVLSVIVKPEANGDGRFAVYIRVFHKLSGRYGTLVLKRSVDDKGEVKLSRRCMDLLVDKEDYKKSNDDVIPVHFISIESITVDPATGLWSELKIALDSVECPLSLFRLGSVRPPSSTRSKSTRGFPRSTRGGFRRGGFRKQGASRRPAAAQKKA